MSSFQDTPHNPDDVASSAGSGVDPEVRPDLTSKAKAPPPGLSMRAPRPPVTRLRKSVVQTIVIGGVILVSGSLAWAFVVQPELRDSARLRAVEGREEQARGSVRPSEAVTDQPATYDRLPEPRHGAEPETAEPGVPPPPPAPARYSAGYAPSRTNRATGPSPGEQAARSGLFFEGASTGAGPAAHAGAGPATAGARADAADVGATYNGHTLTAPLSPYELKAGAIIPAVLLTGVDTARAGPVVATVSQNVYDTVSGRHLVLPQGTRLIGRHEGESAYGDRRAFLTWDRLILPNGKSLVLTGEPGVDLTQVMQDVLGLTKLNFNACIYGDGTPVTLRFADDVGEILTAAPIANLPPLPFKHYI